MKTTTERVQALRDRRYAAGLSQLVLWVPKERAVEIRALVQRHLGDLARPSLEQTQTAEPAARKLVFTEKIRSKAFKAKMRAAGFTCDLPGVWAGDAVSAEDWAVIFPLALAAGGKEDFTGR